MEHRKITIARIWPKYTGKYESRAGVIMGLDPERYRTICVYLSKESENPNFFEGRGYKTYYWSNRKAVNVFNFFVLLKLARILKEERVDIVHCHKHRAIFYGTIAAMIAKTPVVIAHVHGLGRTRNRIRSLANYLMMKKITRIITVGQAVKEDLLASNPHVSPEKVCSIGNSIDYARFADVPTSTEQAKAGLGLSSQVTVFGTVARLSPFKGHACLIDAFAQVKRQIPTAQLVLVGDGPTRAALHDQASKTGFGPSIRFLGQRDDVPRVLRAMDVFVFPSIASEGIPRALLEAMAAGIPCIGANVGGIPEVLDNGRFGVLTPSADSAALAQAMIGLAGMSMNERNGIVERAKQRVKQEYVHEVVTKRLTSIYDSEVAKTSACTRC